MKPSMIFNRTELLLGSQTMQRLREARIIVFGLGGVGSWCAEALARTGVGHLTLVDADCVAESNINRQLPALISTIGLPKVEVMEKRIKDINPEIEIHAIHAMYNSETACEYDFNDYDIVIDAIDSLSDKALLILNATASRTQLFSAMGAALKSDPTRLQVAEFWQVKGCPLAAALRHKFKKNGQFPSKKFKCVFSDELLKNKEVSLENDNSLTYNKVATNGALVTVTATAGMILASLAIKALTD